MANESINPYEDHKPAGGSGLFFSLEDGKTARIRLCSDPYIYEAAFKQPDGGVKISNRYAWIIFDQEAKKVQILKMSGVFFSQVAAIVKDPDYDDIKTLDLKVTRDGTSTDTKYSVLVAPKSRDLTDEDNALIAMADIEDAKEQTILPLREYIQGGSKFPESETTIKDLD